MSLKSTVRGRNTVAFALRIADLTIAVRTGRADMPLGVKGAARRFLTGAERPDLQLDADWFDLREAPAGELVFRSGPLWSLYRLGDQLLYQFSSPALGPAPYKHVLVDRVLSKGTIWMHRAFLGDLDEVSPLEYPLDEILLVALLTRRGGVMLHASGIMTARGGYVFVGHSGAGKSTMAGLWRGQPGVTILSDDRVAVREIEGRLWMYGTPWHGEAADVYPARAPLAGVFFLRQAPQHEVRPVGAAAAAARLFACCFPTFHDADGLASTLQVLESIVQHTPCYDLGFLPRPDIVQAVRPWTP